MKFPLKTLAVVASGSVAAFAVAGNASAAILTESFSATVPLQNTNFNTSVALSHFDPSLGTLQMVTIGLAGVVQGNASAESLDASPATVNLNLGASITATGPVALSVNVTPVNMQVFNASAFDGVIDFAGTSGIAFTNVTGSDTDSSMLTAPPADLSPYIGLGNVIIGIGALGNSSGSGAGNLITQFQTQAGAEVTITYKYDTGTTSTPEPATLLGLMAFGAAGIASRRKG